VSRKSGRIAERIAAFQGQGLDPHYLGYFECFNDQSFYEAHDVLEELWLAGRQRPNGDFFKGLIQLAGAFVHLQKERLRPSASLFKLARTNLQKYPDCHEQLDVRGVLELIERWLNWLEGGAFEANPLRNQPAPRLDLRRQQQSKHPDHHE
jgi:predicted metal-dependent hydrolase